VRPITAVSLKVALAACMDAGGVAEIADELIRLLQQQVDAIAGRKFSDLSDEELSAYQNRKDRILVLRRELDKFVRPT
jgi:hypothetical protein